MHARIDAARGERRPRTPGVDERALGLSIRAQEERLRSALSLEGPARLQELQEALQSLSFALAPPPELGELRAALRQLEATCWALAYSASEVARSEARRHAGPFLDEEDLLQEGYIGLFNAAKRWDPERGIRFRAYARWWIRAQLSYVIDHCGRLVRLPANAADTLRRLREAQDRRRSSGQLADSQSLARELDMDEARVLELLSHGHTLSLETPIEGAERPRPLSSLLRDEESPPPELLALQSQERRQLSQAVERVLNAQQRLVMTRRYGLLDGQERTLAEVGEEMGLSRERIRQIERLSFERLRRRLAATL